MFCLFRSAARQAREQAIADLYAKRKVGKHPALAAPYGNQGANSASKSDDGPDISGFMFGYATGVPISPTHGISSAAMLGAALHPNHASPAPSAPEIRNEPALSAAYEAPSAPASSSHDTGSSYDSGSSSSYDSGGGSSGGSSDGGSF